MTQHLVLLLVGLMSFPAFAGPQARVIKTKGNQAIVQFPSGEKPRVGQVIDIGGDNGPDAEPGEKIGTGERTHSLTVSGELSIGQSSTSGGSSDSSETETAISITGRYGWNKETWEAGPLGTFSMTTGGSTTTRVILVGGFYDWNLVPNRPGTVFVYGLGGYGEFGQEALTPSGGTETSATRMSFFGGGNMKWFGLSENVAVRADAGLGYDRTAASAITTTWLGVKGILSLAFYY
jgi:hypothetical protein